METPPDLSFGELATPIAFELARKLRKAPKVIAQEIVAALGHASMASPSLRLPAPDTSMRGSIASWRVRMMTSGEGRSRPAVRHHALVEHTSINPNKAAHIGHLRNAILGDTFVRLLRARRASKVDVQNYIDNTGVQVADVVVGFLHLEGKSLAEVRALLDELDRNGRAHRLLLLGSLRAHFAVVRRRIPTQNKPRARSFALRHAARDRSTAATKPPQVADLISTAVLRRHLETMLRLGIEYDFLPRESEILHLKFWDAAFEQLKQKGVLYLETEGKNKGCWVMRRAGARKPTEGETRRRRQGHRPLQRHRHLRRQRHRLPPLEVRPARPRLRLQQVLQLSRPRVLDLDRAGRSRRIRTSATPTAIYNVIDSRQNDPQANVIQALRGMGYTEAGRPLHPLQLRDGRAHPALRASNSATTYQRRRQSTPYIEVSGRKGFGVKADDLIDKLIAATQRRSRTRQPELRRSRAPEHRRADRRRRAALLHAEVHPQHRHRLRLQRCAELRRRDRPLHPIRRGARAQIFRKGATRRRPCLRRVQQALDRRRISRWARTSEDIWELWLRAGRRSLVLEQCIATSEPAYLAKHAFQLAQEFNNFYHNHHILTEEDPERRMFLLATAAVALRELITVLDWLGIESPEAM